MDKINKSNELVNYYNLISQEMLEKGLYGPDILLMSYSVPDTISILLSESETYRNLYDENETYKKIDKDILTNYKLINAHFFQIKEKYKKQTLFTDRKLLTDLIKKAKKDSQDILPKSKENISFKDNINREQYINEILTRLKDCVNLYYSAYHNKLIEAELSNGEQIYLEFLEENLLHILGINRKQILLNSELKKILNIPDNGIETTSIKILERIIADLEHDQYIISEQFKKDVDNYQRNNLTNKLSSKQFDDNTTKELLPFDKIDLKTRAFLNDTPYETVSTFVPLAPGQRLTQKNSDTVKISKSSLTEEANNKDSIIDNTEIKLKKGNDYILNEYVKRDEEQRLPISQLVVASENLDEYKRKFAGQKPHNIVSIKSPINGNSTIFSPQEQRDMYLSLLEDFGGEGGMDLNQLLEELYTFTCSYKERIMNELEKRENNLNGYGYSRKK